MKKAICAWMRIAFFLFPFSFFVVAGCNTAPASLMLRPANQKIAYAKTFERAYAGHTADGSCAYVLVSDAAPKNECMRQLVYVKLHWRPMSGTRDSVAANACIDWYVMGDAGSDDLLLYQGAASVTIDPGDKATRVTIRSGDLKPSVTRGNLSDPLGSARVSGTFVAINNDARVHELLDSTRARIAAVSTASGQ